MSRNQTQDQNPIIEPNGRFFALFCGLNAPSLHDPVVPPIGMGMRKGNKAVIDMKMLSFVNFILATLSASVSHAKYNEVCKTVTTPVEYKYCIAKDEKSALTDVIYYLHGSGGDEHEWSFIFPKFLDRWNSTGVKPPVIISVSFGKSWYLVKKNPQAEGSGLLEIYISEIMNRVEREALGHVAKNRTIVGVSMGGVNSALLFLSDLPHPRIRNVAMLAPGLVNLSPWASDDEINAYAAQHGSDAELLRYIGHLSQSLADERAWRKISPYEAIKLPPTPSPSLLVMGNIEDKNFFYGAESFAAAAKKTLPSVLWLPWPGKHSEFQWNDPVLPDFLVN